MIRIGYLFWTISRLMGHGKSYVPKGKYRHIIYTSRQKDAKPDLPKDAIEEVKGIGGEDAAMFLLSVASRPLGHTFLQKQAIPIIRALESLFLAIIQAGGFRYDIKTSLGKYFNELEVQRGNALTSGVYKHSTHSDQAVYFTLDSLYTQLSFWLKRWKGYGKG